MQGEWNRVREVVECPVILDGTNLTGGEPVVRTKMRSQQGADDSENDTSIPPVLEPTFIR